LVSMTFALSISTLNDFAESDAITLNNFYAHSTCTPSRAALLTGRYAHHVGLSFAIAGERPADALDPSFGLLSEELKRLGYNTSLTGKWHLGYRSPEVQPLKRGFDHFEGYLGLTTHPILKTTSEFPSLCHLFPFYLHPFIRLFNAPASLLLQQERQQSVDLCPPKKVDYVIGNRTVGRAGVDKTYLVDMMTERVVKRINSYSHTQRKQSPDTTPPLFEMISYREGHDPVYSPHDRTKCRHIQQKHRRGFCNMMHDLDSSLEQIFKALKGQKDLYEDALIIIVSDNGGIPYHGGNNFPLRGMKGGVLEGAVRVPGFIKIPNQISRQNRSPLTFHEHVHIADIYPTVMGFLTGGAWTRIDADIVPYDIDGIDYSKELQTFATQRSDDDAILMKKENLRPLPLYINPFLKMAAFRKGKWKLTIGKLTDTYLYRDPINSTSLFFGDDDINGGTFFVSRVFENYRHLLDLIYMEGYDQGIGELQHWMVVLLISLDLIVRDFVKGTPFLNVIVPMRAPDLTLSARDFLNFSFSDPNCPQIRLHDLETDPSESVDLYERFPLKASELHKEFLESIHAEVPGITSGVLQVKEGLIEEEVEGYESLFPSESVYQSLTPDNFSRVPPFVPCFFIVLFFWPMIFIMALGFVAIGLAKLIINKN